MASSHFEYVYYSLCLRAEVPTFPLMQDLKQTVNKKKIKNIDFICYSEKKIYLIDVKGTSRLTGDTKISIADMEAMDKLREIYGENAIPLFVYVWMKKKIEYQEEKDYLLQRFRVKCITLDVFRDNMIQQKGWGNKFYRCDKILLNNIWNLIPNFKNLLYQEF